MKTFIKNAGLFLAGGATFMYLFAKGVTENILQPKEGTVVYEDDKMRVVNVGNKNAEERFKDINEAYRMLSDATAKKKYDKMWNNYVRKRKSKEEFKTENITICFVCLFVFVFLPFLGLLLWHMEVPRLGVQSEL